MTLQQAEQAAVRRLFEDFVMLRHDVTLGSVDASILAERKCPFHFDCIIPVYRRVTEPAELNSWLASLTSQTSLVLSERCVSKFHFMSVEGYH